jgi:hypothetical protein
MVMAIGNFSVKSCHHVIAGSVLIVFVPKTWMPGLSASPLKMYARRSGIRLAKIDHSNDHRADRPKILEAARGACSALLLGGLLARTLRLVRSLRMAGRTMQAFPLSGDYLI